MDLIFFDIIGYKTKTLDNHYVIKCFTLIFGGERGIRTPGKDCIPTTV